MRAMKDSGIEWIGEIPERWEIAALKRLGTPATGSTPSKEHADYWDGNIPWVSSKDMKSDYLNDSEDHITKTAVDECGLTLLDPGTLIFCVRSGILRHTFPVAVSTIPVTINQDLRALSLTGDVNPTFLLYYMRGMNDTIVMLYQKIGATVESIEMDWFLYFPVVLPSREEQNQIADYLDAKCAEIDALIAAKEKTNALLKEQRQSIIYEAVTKGLDPTVPMKDSGVEWIGEIPEGWDVGKTIYALSMPITDGPHETPELLNDGIPFVSAEAVSCGNGRIDFDHIRGFISEEYYAECSKKYKPKINDIYMIKSGATTGKVALVDTDKVFTIWSPLAVFRSDETKCHYRFLFYFLQSDAYQKQVEAKWTYGTQQNIGMRSLEKLLMCFPHVDEQVAIANYLDKSCKDISELVRINESAVEQLKEYRQSLIYEAVTGKIDI